MDAQPLIPAAPKELELPRGSQNSQEHHDAMGIVLTDAIHAGKSTVPENPEGLICKPRQIEPWRIFRIMSEFVEGFVIISKYSTAATFFGSTRTLPDNPLYQQAEALAGVLAKRGFAVITGGSSGIMEAANKGAHDAGGSSVGLNIRLASNQASNAYLTDQMMFDHFFVRKTMLSFSSEVYIFFPGGFGTFDELFELLTLIQTKKIRKIPIVLYGKAYWDSVQGFIQKIFVEDFKTIDEIDMNLYVIVDTVEEAGDYITKNVTC